MSDNLTDRLERRLAFYFSHNNQPCMSGDPRDRCSPLQRRNLSEAVQAALEEIEAPVAMSGNELNVSVKALEWDDWTLMGGCQADVFFGQYQVSWLGEFECWQCARPSRAGVEWKDMFSRHAVKAEAKAAAEADYKYLVLSALAIEDYTHRCPICFDPFKPEDICASDITEGTCHAECLVGSPVIDLETGEETGGKVDTYRYSEVVGSALSPQPTPNVEGSPLLEWAVERWIAQVKHRPLVNVHRQSLDDVWRQVIRWAGGDPDSLVGPSHDELLSTSEENR